MLITAKSMYNVYTIICIALGDAKITLEYYALQVCETLNRMYSNFIEQHFRRFFPDVRIVFQNVYIAHCMAISLESI